MYKNVILALYLLPAAFSETGKVLPGRMWQPRTPTSRYENQTTLPEMKCGIDRSTNKEVEEGVSTIETYPWLGVLIFPLRGVITSSPVILITKQLVVGAAIEIANLPKIDFRARTKVILGHNCTGPRYDVLDYTYHPDFRKNTYSSLVLIQLKVYAHKEEILTSFNEFSKRRLVAIRTQKTLKELLNRIVLNITDFNSMNPFINETKMNFVSFIFSLRRSLDPETVMINLPLESKETYYSNLKPICPPPSIIQKPDFYAVSLSEDCMNSNVELYRMTYVDTKECKSFYRRTGLDVESIWPKYTVCAKAVKGGGCLWQSGVFLIMKQQDRWMLIGFGVYGPGCGSPARFLDYGMYHQWVRNNIERIGKPAITRLAPNHVIMRRRLTNVQRFGPCDPEETRVEIYTDHTAIEPRVAKSRSVVYNFTILAAYEYSCIVFRCNQNTGSVPTIHLKRLCLASHVACYQFTTLQIDFEIEILYFDKIEYHVNVYGEELHLLDTKRINVQMNKNQLRPDIATTFTPYMY